MMASEGWFGALHCLHDLFRAKVMMPRPTLASSRARRVRLLSCDVDGVLTDGKIYYADDGSQLKAFSTLDGFGLKMLQESGVSRRLDFRAAARRR